MGLSAWAAAWFLVAAVPIGFFVAFSDLARMKIPNIAVGALLLSYAAIGLIALPFEQYLWHWTHFFVVLVIGFVLNAAGAFGAGDAKFMAGAAPMVAVDDLRLLLPIFAASLLAGYVTHRIAKHSPLRRAVPHWESWTAGKRFPMGFPLAMTLIAYLLIVIMLRG